MALVRPACGGAQCPLSKRTVLQAMGSFNRVGAFSAHTSYHEPNLGLIDVRYAQAPVRDRITMQPFAASPPAAMRLDAQLMNMNTAPNTAPNKVHYIANFDSTGRSIKYPEIKFAMSAPNHSEFPALTGLVQAAGNLWKTTVESTVIGPVLAGWRASAVGMANLLNEPASRFVPYTHSELVEGKYINATIPSRQTQAAHDLFVGAPRKLLDMAMASGSTAPVEVPTQLLSAASTHTLQALEKNWARAGVPALQEQAMTQFFEHGVLPLGLAAVPAVAVGRHVVTGASAAPTVGAEAVGRVAVQARYQRQTLPIDTIHQRYELIGPQGEISSDLVRVTRSIEQKGFDPRHAIEAVRFDDGTVLLLDGQVRLTGAQLAGKAEIPVDVYARGKVSSLDVAKALVQAAINQRIDNATFRKYMPALSDGDRVLLDAYTQQEFLRKQAEAVRYAQTQRNLDPRASAPIMTWAPPNPAAPVQWTDLWHLAQQEKKAMGSNAAEIMVTQVGNAKDGVRLIESGSLPELFARALARQQQEHRPVRIVGYTQLGTSNAQLRLPTAQAQEALRQLHELQATKFPGKKIAPTFMQYGPRPENKFYLGADLSENARILNGLEYARQQITKATQNNPAKALEHTRLGWGVDGGVDSPHFRLVDGVLVVRMGDMHPITAQVFDALMNTTVKMGANSLRIELPAVGSKPVFDAYVSKPEWAARITRENDYDFDSGNFRLNDGLDVISVSASGERVISDHHFRGSNGVDRAFNLLTRYANGERQFTVQPGWEQRIRTPLADVGRPWPDSHNTSQHTTNHHTPQR